MIQCIAVDETIDLGQEGSRRDALDLVAKIARVAIVQQSEGRCPVPQAERHASTGLESVI
jgi:hypothetical protein